MTATTLPPAMDDPVAPLQHEVQRKLGRCLIRLQQYEQLLKAMVAQMTVEGPPAQLQSIRDEQVACARTKTLGMLVGMFTGSYLTPATSEGAAEPDDEGDDEEPPSQPWFKIRHRLALPPEHFERIKQALAELVAMRNALVHHFLERFDLGLEAGCLAANVYLEGCYGKIDSHYLELMQWAKQMDETRALAASIMQTPQYEDIVFHGIWLDGSVDWGSSTIVACLRSAERSCAVNSWTLLDSAILFIRATHPDHTPARYGCKNWRQVLKKSGQFGIRTDTNLSSGKGQTWYRSQEDAAISAGLRHRP